MNKLIVKYRAIVKSRKKSLWFSAITAFLLLLVCYFADNLSYSILSGPSVGQRIEQLKELVGLTSDEIPSEYVFINVAYDKELVTVYDEYGLPKGEIDITNRTRLANFLSLLHDSHRYIMMDVLLSNDYQSKNDSLLLSSITKTDRISVARSSTTELLDTSLIERSGYTDYSTDILETNFVKYEFLNGGESTMPYMTAQALGLSPKVYKFGPFYFSDGHLCWKSLTLRFPIKMWRHSKHDDASPMSEKVLLNLGSDILDLGVSVPELVKDKIVVIGDFTEDDIHDTYIGKIAGPVINVNAVEALRANEFIIPWSFIVFLLLFYTLMGYLAVRNIGVTQWIQMKLRIKSSLGNILLSIIGYSFFLSIIAGVIYLTTGMDMNVLIPSLWFTALSGITKTFAS